MTRNELISQVRQVLLLYPIRRAGLFGSYARSQQHNGSDVDILVEVDESLSLLDFVGIKLALEDSLQKKVDLVEYKALKPLLRQQILAEQIAIL